MKKYTSVFQERINELFNRESYRAAADGERLTKPAFAEKLGTTLNSVRGWLSGSGQPDTEMLAKIARAENVTVDWLVGRSDDPHDLGGDPQRERLIKKIREADFETLAKLEQFANFLEYEEKKAAAPDKKAARG